jgi:hypothetical protein
MADQDESNPRDLFQIAIGTARLPNSITSDGGRAFLIELLVDAKNSRIIDLSATLPLPHYVSILRSLLIGRAVSEVEEVCRRLATYVRGPLLRPTAAALANAAANYTGRAPTPAD